MKVNFILLKTQEQTTDQSSSLINFAIMILAIFQKSILQHHNTDILSSPSWRSINWRDSCINNSLKTFGHSHLVFIFFFCSLVEISRTHCISAALLQLCPLAWFYILPLTEKQLQPKTHGISWIADLIEFTWKQQRPRPQPDALGAVVCVSSLRSPTELEHFTNKKCQTFHSCLHKKQHSQHHNDTGWRLLK